MYIQINTIASQTQDLPNFTVKQKFLQLRYTFIQGKSGTFDGSLMVSATNNFIPKKNKNKDREQQSDKWVSFTIYDGGDLNENNYNGIIEYERNYCFPY